VQTKAGFARSVLDAARRFVKKGLHGVSMDQIEIVRPMGKKVFNKHAPKKGMHGH